MSRQEGLKHKYNVSRADGQLVGDCIVLEFDDPNSWPALAAWAETVRLDGYEELANDVHERIRMEIRFDDNENWD